MLALATKWLYLLKRMMAIVDGQIKKRLSLAVLDRDTKYTGFGEIVKDKKGELTGTLCAKAPCGW
ncbi:MAG: hypothetical protein U5K54_14155 [Cytophagales bacterium]|nr:hypothetical protein [Cytophagales bacterium]